MSPAAVSDQIERSQRDLASSTAVACALVLKRYFGIISTLPIPNNPNSSRRSLLGGQLGIQRLHLIIPLANRRRIRPRRQRPLFHSRIGSPRPGSDTNRRAARFPGTRGTGSPPIYGYTQDTHRRCGKYSTPCHSWESIAIGYRLWGATRTWGNRFLARASVFLSPICSLIQWTAGSLVLLFIGFRW